MAAFRQSRKRLAATWEADAIGSHFEASPAQILICYDGLVFSPLFMGNQLGCWSGESGWVNVG